MRPTPSLQLAISRMCKRGFNLRQSSLSCGALASAVVLRCSAGFVFLTRILFAKVQIFQEHRACATTNIQTTDKTLQVQLV